MCISLCMNRLILFDSRSYRSRNINRKLSTISCTRLDKSQKTTTGQQQLNLPVLRFTLGEQKLQQPTSPGFDESYLPRWIGYAFGSLLLVNHFAGLNSTVPTPAQLRSEALGLSLAGFSIVLPYLGKFFKNIAENVKEDLAWGKYVLLRNTNAISVLISVQDALCVRGYWNTPGDVSNVDALGWFQKHIQWIGLSDLEDTLYFPQSSDSELWEMLPKGTRSVLVQPVQQSPKGDADQEENNKDRQLMVDNKFESNAFLLLDTTSEESNQ